MATGADTTVMCPHAQDAEDGRSHRSRETGSPPRAARRGWPCPHLALGLGDPRTVGQ